MKNKIVAVAILSLIIINICAVFSYAEEIKMDPPPEIKSEAAILIDADSGRVLFEKNPDKMLYPASTTKIMTAVLVLEKLNMNDVVEAGKSAIASIPPGGSNMGLVPGEQLTVDQLLHGVLVQSANEACNVLAEYISGDVETFVELMNQKAQELGMTHTHFKNPHGLHEAGHETTARDLGVLAKYAMKNKEFRDIVAMTEYIIEPTNKNDKPRTLYNTNYLIGTKQSAEYYYKKAIGIKTGYTSQAGNCLVSAAVQSKKEFIAVTLNATPVPGIIYSFKDSTQIFEYGFKNYDYQTIVKPDEVLGEAKVNYALNANVVALVSASDFSSLLPIDFNIDNITKVVEINDDVAAPVVKGQVLGRVTYSYKGDELGSVDLIASADTQRDDFVFVMSKIGAFIWRPHIYIPLAILLVLLIIVYSFRQLNRRKRKTYLRSQRYKKKKK